MGDHKLPIGSTNLDVFSQTLMELAADDRDILVITSDSLGLHLALGLNKKVVALFGPTAPEQIYMYGQGMKISTVCQRACVPCYQTQCDFEQTCMEDFDVETVVEAIELLTSRKRVKPSVDADAVVEMEVLAGVGS